MTRQRRQRIAGFSVLAAVVLVLVYLFRGPLTRVLSFAQRPLVNTGTWVAGKTLDACEALKLAPDDAQTLAARVL